jgi:hypothetical protein
MAFSKFPDETVFSVFENTRGEITILSRIFHENCTTKDVHLSIPVDDARDVAAAILRVIDEMESAPR